MESYTQKWVDKENGFVKREAFVSEDVYKLEIDRLFNHNWIFLGHETEIPDEEPDKITTVQLACDYINQHL